MISNNTRLRSDGVAVAWKEWEESELETDRPNPGPIQVRLSVHANWGVPASRPSERLAFKSLLGKVLNDAYTSGTLYME
jgi:hypothetical protein